MVFISCDDTYHDLELSILVYNMKTKENVYTKCFPCPCEKCRTVNLASCHFYVALEHSESRFPQIGEFELEIAWEDSDRRPWSRSRRRPCHSPRMLDIGADYTLRQLDTQTVPRAKSCIIYEKKIEEFLFQSVTNLAT